MAIGPVDRSLPLMVELNASQSSSDGQHASDGACSRRQFLSLINEHRVRTHLQPLLSSSTAAARHNAEYAARTKLCLIPGIRRSVLRCCSARLQSFSTSADPRKWSAKGQACTVHYVVLTQPAKSIHYCRRTRCATTRPYQPLHKVVTKGRSTGFECRYGRYVLRRSKRKVSHLLAPRIVAGCVGIYSKLCSQPFGEPVTGLRDARHNTEAP